MNRLSLQCNGTAPVTRKRSSHEDDHAATVKSIGLGCKGRRNPRSLRTRYQQTKLENDSLIVRLIFSDTQIFKASRDKNPIHRLDRVAPKTRLIHRLSQFSDGLELKLGELLKAKPSLFDSAHFNYPYEVES